MGKDRKPGCANPSLAEVAAARFSRRQALTGLGAGAAVLSTVGGLGTTIATRIASAAGASSSLTFIEPERILDGKHRVAPGYRATVLVRWGDPIVTGAPDFDPGRQTAAAQARQFGYNNDFIAYMPLPLGSQASDHGLLCVNNEYTLAHMMWPGFKNRGQAQDRLTRAQVEIEMQATGHSVVEVRRGKDGWRVVADSPYGRRITAMTPVSVSGPAAGHARMKTPADPSGTRVLGTVNNCGGGKTPWGTILICEENFHYYFGGAIADRDQASHYRRYGVKEKGLFGWRRFDDRFDLGIAPNEPNRFGWVVEYDPYDPNSVPVKRTALGRFMHEAAATWLDKSGRVVVYSGDDAVFQYLYRFVSDDVFDPETPARNRDLLDQGVLSVAQFADDGKVAWLPLVFGSGPLIAANGFASQADVVIEARRAAELLGATPMDRPEDVEVNPVTGRVYVMLSKNSKRSSGRADAVNPRGPNPYGHIVELLPPGLDGDRDHGAGAFGWEILLLAGDPRAAEADATYHTAVSDRGWLAAPDNCTFDRRGRLWIATDQGRHGKTKIPDGLYACDLDGEGRALTRFFFGCPRGAEMAGPEFTPDGRTLFVSVQHPADEKRSTFDRPSTRWPDFDPSLPPRPSVVAITKQDGGEIGD
ncbi:MAG: PhoX family phosphatase [Alphaproteobacteria bacterium]|nr:PhoX family phosphatase [Alphaproteobacteria bacterium]